MPLRFNDNPDGPVVMTKDELRALKGLPPRKRTSRSPGFYTVEERIPGQSPLLLPSVQTVQVVERRPKKARSERMFEIPAAPWAVEVPAQQQQQQQRRFEVPPPSAYSFPSPAPFILPAPLPQPIVAEPQYETFHPPPPPPAPEVPREAPPPPPTYRQRSPSPIRRADILERQSSSLRVEVPTSRRSRPSSVSSPLSERSSARSHYSAGDSSDGHRRRRTRHDTPQTSASSSRADRKERKMIDEPSKGPRAWDEGLPGSRREQVVYRNADGTKTRHYYYE